MKSHKEHLAKLLTQRLSSNPALQEEASNQLIAHLEGEQVPDHEIAEAIQTVERGGRTWLGRHWQKILVSASALVVLAGAIDSVRLRARIQAVKMLVADGIPFLDETPPPRPRVGSAANQLLLEGARDAADSASRWQALWDSDPANPVYFAEYVRGVMEVEADIPDKLLEESEKIDPDNGWYLAMKGGFLAKKAVKAEPVPKAQRKELKAKVHTVSDEEVLAQAIDAFHQAAQKPRFDSYREEISMQRFAALEPPTDFLSSLRHLVHSAGASMSDVIGMRYFSDAIGAEATRCAERGDAAGLQRLISTWEKLNTRFLTEGYTMVEGLVARVIIGDAAANLRDSATKLGLEMEAARFKALAEWQYRDWNARQVNQPPSTEGRLINDRASLFTGLTIPMLSRQVDDPPELTEENLRPARLMEHAFFLQAMTSIGTFLLLLLIATLAIRLASLPLILRSVSGRASLLVPPMEWMRMILLGAILPCATYFGLLYLSPLTTRDWSPRLIGIYQFPLQFASFLVFSLTTTGVLVSWCCDRRLRAICPPSRFPRLRWFLLASSGTGLLLASSLTTLVHLIKAPSPVLFAALWAACLFSAIPLLWLLFRIIEPLFRKRAATPRNACLIRMALPVLLVTFLALSATIPLLRMEERHWLSKETIMVPQSGKPGFTPYEWEVSQILKKELAKVLAGR